MSNAPRKAASQATTWPARYAFCDTLWRGRARLIVDPELESALCEWVGGRVPTDATAGLLESLVPRERAVPVWVVVGSDATVRLLAPHFPGARFLAVDTLDDRLARLPWETALVTVDHRPASPRQRDVEDGGAPVSATGAESVALDVAAAMRPGRIAVVSAISNLFDYDGFAEQLRPTFGEARIYGGYAPGMFAFVEFVAELRPVTGEFVMSDEHQTLRLSQRQDEAEIDEGDEVLADVEEIAGDAWDDGEALGDDDGTPLTFDNTLGPDAPPYAVWLGVIGATGEFGEGLTLVEMPPAEVDVDDAGADDTAGDHASGDHAFGDHASGDQGALPEIRAQLQQSRALAESSTLERQRLVERLDAALADNATLRDSVTKLREQLAAALDQPPAGERLDAALAREQSLRWRVAALERELAELRVRPVDELEAEAETLRARLDAVLAEQAAKPERGETRDVPAHDGAPRGRGEPLAHAAVDARRGPAMRPMHRPDAARRLASPRAGSGRAAALRVIEGLVRRIEHGVERATLRRELLALRRRLGG